MSIHEEGNPLEEAGEENEKMREFVKISDEETIEELIEAGPKLILQVSDLVPEELIQMSVGINNNKRNEMLKVLDDIFAGTERWQKQIDGIVVDEFGVKAAEFARKQIKSVRLDAEKIFDAKRNEVKRMKATYDLEDALWLKSKQIMQLKFKHLENQAEEIATHFERLEKQRLDELVQERMLALSKYEHNYSESLIRSITDDDFDGLLLSLYEKEQARIDAEIARVKKEEEEKAEAKRVAEAEKEERRLEKERLDAENKKLIEEQKEKDRISQLALKKQKEENDKLVEANKANQKILEEQTEANNKEIARLQKIKDDAEAENKRLVEAEKKRLDDIEKAKQDKIDADKAEAERQSKLSHNEKVIAWINSFPEKLPETDIPGSVVYNIKMKYKFFIDWAKKEVK